MKHGAELGKQFNLVDSRKEIEMQNKVINRLVIKNGKIEEISFLVGVTTSTKVPQDLEVEGFGQHSGGVFSNLPKNLKELCTAATEGIFPEVSCPACLHEWVQLSEVKSCPKCSRHKFKGLNIPQNQKDFEDRWLWNSTMSKAWYKWQVAKKITGLFAKIPESMTHYRTFPSGTFLQSDTFQSYGVWSQSSVMEYLMSHWNHSNNFMAVVNAIESAGEICPTAKVLSDVDIYATVGELKELKLLLQNHPSS